MQDDLENYVFRCLENPNLNITIKNLLNEFIKNNLNSKFIVQIRFDHDLEFKVGDIYLFDISTLKGKYVLYLNGAGFDIYSYLDIASSTFEPNKLIHAKNAEEAVEYLNEV